MTRMLTRGRFGVVAVSLLIAGCTGTAGGSASSQGSTSTASFTAPAAKRIHVVYAGHGVELIATGVDFNSASAMQPHLYLSDDLVHWRDITPPAALVGPGIAGDVNLITHASWINATTGWIETCRNLSFTQAIFQTNDGGRTWRSVPDPSEANTHRRCADSIQLLNADVGIDSGARQEGLGGQPLHVTKDDGRTWTAPYALVDGGSTDVPNGGVRFENPNDAVALGSRPYGSGPGIEVSHDAGRTWTAVLPPAPPYPTIRYNPVAFGNRDEVLPVVGVNPGGAATAQLDTSTDGGSTWSVASHVSFQAQVLPPTGVVPMTTGPTYQEDVALSVTDDGTWWLTLPTAPATTEASVDQGRSWTKIDRAGLPADAFITPVSGTSALATAASSTASTTADMAYGTVDRGQTWTPVDLPSD